MIGELLKKLVWTGQSDSVAFLDDEGSYTYGMFRHEVHSYQDFIQSFHFPAYSRIVLCLPNGMRAIAALLAVLSGDMIAVPVSVDTPMDTLRQMQTKVQAVATVTMQCDGGLRVKQHVYEAWEDSPSNGCMILFTSGTTGYLKGVELSAGAILETVCAVADYMCTNANDRYYVIKDYTHCSSLISEIFVALYCGCSICLYNPRAIISLSRRRIKEDKPTVMGVNPWLLELICRQKAFRSCYDSLRVVVSSGSVLSERLAAEASAFFYNAQVINVYGLTEAGSRVCAQRPNSHSSPGSVGRPIGRVEVKLEKATLSAESGEVFIKTPGLMLRYYNDSGATNEKIINGWLKTGDEGRFTESGDLVIIGRMDDMIISGGHNIDPVRVAEVIGRYPGIMDVVIVGVRQNIVGEVPMALVVFDGIFDEVQRSAIEKHCRERLYGFECPKRYFAVPEIPRTFSGKVSKAALQKIVEGFLCQ